MPESLLQLKPLIDSRLGADGKLVTTWTFHYRIVPEDFWNQNLMRDHLRYRWRSPVPNRVAGPPTFPSVRVRANRRSVWGSCREESTFRRD